nr:hypothetical protein GCM10023233_04740 [Brevibacterium otitidis]
MTDRITRWLDESQQLADRAHPGPWEAATDCGLPDPDDSRRVVYSVLARTRELINGIAFVDKPDAEFIAESRTRLPQAVAALRDVLGVLDRWAPPDPHEPDEDCPDCELLHHARRAIIDALGLEGDDHDDLG